MIDPEWEIKPQDLVATEFMAHKGYTNVRPFEVEQLEDQKCWYYTYSLDEGMLELEVAWDPDTGWETYVTAFKLHEDF